MDIIPKPMIQQLHKTPYFYSFIMTPYPLIKEPFAYSSMVHRFIVKQTKGRFLYIKIDTSFGNLILLSAYLLVSLRTKHFS